MYIKQHNENQWNYIKLEGKQSSESTWHVDIESDDLYIQFSGEVTLRFTN